MKHVSRQPKDLHGGTTSTYDCLQYFLRGAKAQLGPTPPHRLSFLMTYTPKNSSERVATSSQRLPPTQQARGTSTPSARFKPAIPAVERPQIHALDRSATGNSNTSENFYVQIRKLLRFITTGVEMTRGANDVRQWKFVPAAPTVTLTTEGMKCDFA